MQIIPEILTTLVTGIFAGAALYVNLVEQPARLSCGIKPAVTQWRPSYKRGTVMQAPLAVMGSLLAFLSWRAGGSSAWLMGGILLLAIPLFTLIVILPTNRRLESEALDLSSARAENLLRRWGRLHAVRSTLSIVAFVMFLVALSKRR